MPNTKSPSLRSADKSLHLLGGDSAGVKTKRERNRTIRRVAGAGAAALAAVVALSLVNKPGEAPGADVRIEKAQTEENDIVRHIVEHQGRIDVPLRLDGVTLSQQKDTVFRVQQDIGDPKQASIKLRAQPQRIRDLDNNDPGTEQSNAVVQVGGGSVFDNNDAAHQANTVDFRDPYILTFDDGRQFVGGYLLEDASSTQKEFENPANLADHMVWFDQGTVLSQESSGARPGVTTGNVSLDSIDQQSLTVTVGGVQATVPTVTYHK